MRGKGREKGRGRGKGREERGRKGTASEITASVKYGKGGFLRRDLEDVCVCGGGGNYVKQKNK